MCSIIARPLPLHEFQSRCIIFTELHGFGFLRNSTATGCRAATFAPALSFGERLRAVGLMLLPHRHNDSPKGGCLEDLSNQILHLRTGDHPRLRPDISDMKTVAVKDEITLAGALG